MNTGLYLKNLVFLARRAEVTKVEERIGPVSGKVIRTQRIAMDFEDRLEISSRQLKLSNQVMICRFFLLMG